MTTTGGTLVLDGAYTDIAHVGSPRAPHRTIVMPTSHARFLEEARDLDLGGGGPLELQRNLRVTGTLRVDRLSRNFRVDVQRIVLDPDFDAQPELFTVIECVVGEGAPADACSSRGW